MVKRSSKMNFSVEDISNILKGYTEVFSYDTMAETDTIFIDGVRKPMKWCHVYIDNYNKGAILEYFKYMNYKRAYIHKIKTERGDLVESLRNGIYYEYTVYMYGYFDEGQVNEK